MVDGGIRISRVEMVKKGKERKKKRCTEEVRGKKETRRSGWMMRSPCVLLVTSAVASTRRSSPSVGRSCYYDHRRDDGSNDFLLNKHRYKL